MTNSSHPTYPAFLVPDPDGGTLVRFPDAPDLMVRSRTRIGALRQGAAALSRRMLDQESPGLPVQTPSSLQSAWSDARWSEWRAAGELVLLHP